MSKHDSEYRELLSKVMQRDRDSIEAHWELGELFARYGEPVTEIAQAVERGVTFVADHIRIIRVIPSRADLAAVLENRDDITTWTVLTDWVKSGGPPQESDEDPDAADISRQKRQGGGARGGAQGGGLQLTVPAHIIKGLADMGLNPRECLGLFWQNASPSLIMNVAYAGMLRMEAEPAPELTPAFREPAEATP